jgi:hypothetical protein
MEILIQKIAKQCRIAGSDLLTRPAGRQLYGKVKTHVAKARPEEVVVLDFAGYSVIDPSCVDELIVNLVRDSMNPEKPFFLRLRNITPIMDMNISMVFDSYAEFAGMRIGVITEDLISRRGHFIGKMSETERELLEYLHVSRTASVREIADHLHSDADGVEKALESLYELRCVRRENTRRAKGFSRV